MSECDRCGKKIKYGTLCHDCDIYLTSYCQGLRDGKKQGRAYEKAKIVNIAKRIENWCWKHQEYNQDDLNDLMDIAEQLKGEH